MVGGIIKDSLNLFHSQSVDYTFQVSLESLPLQGTGIPLPGACKAASTSLSLSSSLLSPPPPQVPRRILHNLTRLVLAQPESDWAPWHSLRPRPCGYHLPSSRGATLRPDCFRFPNTRNSSTQGSSGPHGSRCLEHFPSRRRDRTHSQTSGQASSPAWGFPGPQQGSSWVAWVCWILYAPPPAWEPFKGGGSRVRYSSLTPGPRASIGMDGCVD